MQRPTHRPRRAARTRSTWRNGTAPCPAAACRNGPADDAMTDRARFRRAAGAAAGIVDGQTVIVSPMDLRYHALNTTATAIWDLLADGTSVDQAVERLIATFDVDEPTCREEVEACLSNFVAIGIATPTAAPGRLT